MSFKKISGDAFMQMDDSEQEEEYTRAVKEIRRLENKLKPKKGKCFSCKKTLPKGETNCGSFECK